MAAKRTKLCAGDAQNVKTFVADEWTLEYDLEFAGRTEVVLIAAMLAANDDPDGRAIFQRTTDGGLSTAGSDRAIASSDTKAQVIHAVFAAGWSEQALYDAATDSPEAANAATSATQDSRRGPWRDIEAVEFATLEWVDWFCKAIARTAD